MKNLLVSTFCAFLILSCNKPQELKYSTTTTKNVEITNIEQTEAQTRIDLKVNAVRYKPNGFKVSLKDTYIQNSKDNEKIDVLSIEGLVFDETYLDTIFENIKYTLVFPPLDKTIETIDFISDNTQVYDIELVPQTYATKIPEELKGNWLKTDGSNQWVYGIYENVVIYNDEFWNEYDLEKKGKLYHLTLKKGEATEALFIKKSKSNNLLIGNSIENLKLFSRNKTSRDDFILENDVDIEETIFKEGIAVYKGFIKGYHPKMNWDVKAYVADVIGNTQVEYPFELNANGTFRCEIPLNYVQIIFVRIGNLSEYVFLEPKKTTLQFIDLSEHNSSYQGIKQRNSRKRKSIFMGDVSRLNNEMKSMEFINYREHGNYHEQILEMSPIQYKKYWLDIMEKEEDSLKYYLEKNQTTKKAQQLKAMQISFRTASNILAYESDKRGASMMKERREKKDLDFEKKQTIEIEEELTASYFDFLDKSKMNNPASLMLGMEYFILINRVSYGPQLIEFGVFYNYFDILINKINERGIHLSKAHRNMLNKLLNCKTSKEFKSIINIDEKKLWNSFRDTFDNIMTESMGQNFDRIKRDNRKSLYGIYEGFSNDLILAQEMVGIIKNNHEPFNKWHLSDIEASIENENIKEILIKFNKLKEFEYSENIENVDYYLHETPDVESGELFEAILKNHKSKAVFIDFWATWCGPCLHGIERSKNYKEKYKNKEIEFVYITGATSPLATFNKAIQGIKGHHYRLNDEQWEYIMNYFGIEGIPRYMFIDKNGKMINENLEGPFISGELENLVKEYL